MLYRRVTRQPKSLNGLMKWHIRLSLCAATATAKWIKCFAFPDNRAVATGITGKTTSIFDAWSSVWAGNLPALNQNDVLVYGHTHLPVAEQRGEIFHFNPGSVSIPKGGHPASYGMLDNDVLSVIALNDQSIIAQVAINP